MTTRVLLGALIMTVLCIANQSHAQDPVVVSPDIYTVLFENEEIRVLELTFEPGEREAMHSHPKYCIVTKEGGTLRIHTEGNEPRKRRDANGSTTMRGSCDGPLGRECWRYHSSRDCSGIQGIGI